MKVLEKVYALKGSSARSGRYKQGRIEERPEIGITKEVIFCSYLSDKYTRVK